MDYLTEEALNFERALRGPFKELLLYRQVYGQIQPIRVGDATYMDELLNTLWSMEQHLLPEYWLFQCRNSVWFQYNSQSTGASRWMQAAPHQVPKTVRTYHLLYV